jgi:NADH:ubiquinone oxidoreductase subunit 2 (subunit N)
VVPAADPAVSLLPFLAATFGGGALALMARRDERVSVAIATVGLLLAVVAAAGIRADDPVGIGGSTLAGTDYARLFLLLGSLTGLLITLLGVATTMPRDLAGSILLGLGAAGLALGAADPVVAVLAASAGSFLGVFVTLVPPRSAVGAAIAGRELRALAGGAGLAVLAAAWTARPLDVLAAEPAATGLAFLGFTAAVAIRFGAIPFHRWAARLAEAAPEMALPLILAWGPAALAVVALAALDSSVGATGAPLAAERAIIVAVGAASLLLGMAAAYLHEDLEHVVAYSIVADAGIVLLAFGALDSGIWGSFRTWLLAFVVTKSALAAWAAAMRSTFGARRLGDLGGWMRRAPVLAAAFGVLAIATIGWPGLAMFDARGAIVAAATDGPLTAIVLIGTLGHVGYLGRILAAGVGRRSAAVASGADPRPTWPPHHRALRPADLLAAWRVNRAPAAAVLVLLLAGLALAVTGGAFGGPRAAAGFPPQPTPGPSTSPSVEPVPSPSPTSAPSVVPTPIVSPSSGAPSPSGSGSPGASGGALPGDSPLQSPPRIGSPSAEVPSFVPLSPSP